MIEPTPIVPARSAGARDVDIRPPAPPPAGGRPGGGDGDRVQSDLFDYALLRDHAGFVLGSPLRHKLLAAACLVAAVAAGALSLWALPQSWRTETRLLAQRNPVMSTLANPTFGRPLEADAPTRAARETILGWDNLVALVNQTNLTTAYLETRAPAVRLRDWVRGLVRRELTHDELVTALAYTLEKRLSVHVQDGTVTIGVEWTDPVIAQRLADAALQNFLEARHASEISIVGEAISILEGHAGAVRRELDVAVDQLATLQQQAKARNVVSRDLAALRPVSMDDELARVASLLGSKRRALADLEEFRQRRSAELHANMAQQRTIYADAHPSVQALRQAIAQLAQPSPQVETLRAEVEALEREVIRRGGRLLDGTPRSSDPGLARIQAEIAGSSDPMEDPRLGHSRGQLRVMFAKYERLLDRLDGARMEMDTAQAAFKYRYSVIAPPQLPRSPQKPNAPLVVAGSVIAGVLLAFFVAAAADVRSRRILQSWQIERHLGLPVLSEPAR